MLGISSGSPLLHLPLGGSGASLLARVREEVGPGEGETLVILLEEPEWRGCSEKLY